MHDYQSHATVSNIASCFNIWHKVGEAEHSVQHLHHYHFVERLHIVLKCPTFKRIDTLQNNKVGNYRICHGHYLKD